MEHKRKLNYVSNVFDYQNIPKAPRSTRKKVSSSCEDDQLCAIDLLASLAGKLLKESESYSSNYAPKKIKQEHGGDHSYDSKTCKSELSSLENEQTPIIVESGDITKETIQDPESVHLDGVTKLVVRDDDEKYSKLSNKCKSFRPLKQVGNRRMKAPYRKRKCGYGYSNIWRQETGFRKRRVLVVNNDEGLSSESVTNSPKKSLYQFSIKSFKIPELLIELPQTATVGSLKRTVKEAVTALLGDGIRIGLLLQGKKVRDDNNTLSESGLSSRANLGFSLEPAASPLKLDTTIPLPLQDPIAEDNQDELVPYQSDDNKSSRAMFPVLALKSEANEIVPVNVKPKRIEVSQRRSRRPFSVTEVEALVQAVEQIGTGRWRDVKLRSFENESHRTYVDLKDKWKTLVHTASISPQQRRGEPVPQELLDRVLAAHKCWSKHQMKHQVAATMVVS